MRIAIGTATILALFVFVYIAWVNPSSDVPIGPQRDEAREELGNWEWFDPVVDAQLGLFNPTQAPQIDSPEANALEALGYLQGYEPAKALKGVVTYDPQRAQPGYNLYVSAHAPEVHLMTMEGKILHTWKYDFRDACPDDVAEVHPGQRWFRRAKLLENGELLAVFDYAALIKLDRDSRLLWARCQAYHHDIEVDSSYRILTLEAKPAVMSRDQKDFPVQVDFLAILDLDGQPLDEVSLVDALAGSGRDSLLNRAAWTDILHTNSIALLDGSAAHRSEAFQFGNVLLSMRNIDAIAIVDPSTWRVPWALLGAWRAQHEAVMTRSGGVLLFDNTGRDGRSRVIEIDPITEQVLWSYDGDTADGLFSPVCGSNQRLANGNTLITESTAGRALEVTPEGTIVWDFRSPHRIDSGGKELVALLGDLERISRERMP
jgi:hypothetical protein